MSIGIQVDFAPRKTPLQTRATLTVEAILEATIQVLLRDGFEKLTTTRIADRAGVSVGTLYQYYPNKKSLLRALLERHLECVIHAVERACEANHHQPLQTMVEATLTAFLDAKLKRREVSLALYAIASDLGSAAIVEGMRKRMMVALTGMLETAPDVHFRELEFTAFVFYSSLVGATRAFLESGARQCDMETLRRHLIWMSEAYLTRAAHLPGK